MSLRIQRPVWQCLNASSNPSQHVTRSFSSTPSSLASTVKQRKRRQDPYAAAQAAARKAANLSRQEVLKKERAAALGDPVRGIETPFLKSLDNATPIMAKTDSLLPQTPQSAPSSRSNSAFEQDDTVNFYLKKDELESAVRKTRWLSTPPPRIDDVSKSGTAVEEAEILSQQHDNAEEAIRRIASLSLGSSKDRQRANTQRILNVFGRHNTDQTLPPRSVSATALGNVENERLPRAGPDTGSSEVQIALLTAKIRTLADFLQGRGRKDKVNKRNLRLLVHRRQKLLAYLHRKERGGPRWQHLVETLGLTEGTWKGEISL